MRLSLDVERTEFLVFLIRKFNVKDIKIRLDTHGQKIVDTLWTHGPQFVVHETRKNPPLHDEWRKLLGELLNLKIEEGCYFRDCAHGGVLT